MDLYREEVMDHYEHPRNQGNLSGEGVISESENNASCGDRVQLFIKVKNGVVEQVKWEGEGCAIMSASASKLSEYLQGQALKDLKEMSEEELAKKGVGFEVNVGRMKCLMLSVKAVKKLVA